MNDWIYDLETYPNCFTAKFMNAVTGYLHTYEISTRRNDCPALVDFLQDMSMGSVRLVGFNNLGFDYPILHHIMVSQGAGCDAWGLYQKAQSILASQRGFPQTVKPWDVLIPQVDLFKIHHFDNVAKSTGLKALQFNMRSDSVEDLPFPVGTLLTPEQMDVLHDYNFHDVAETLKFYYESKQQIDFRDTLSRRYEHDFTNHNDTKIGKDYFVMQLEAISPGSCYDQNRQPKQTLHPSGVAIAPLIFPYVAFQHPELNRVLQWFREQVIGENERPSVSATIDGFTFDFGVGGVHGSVESTSFEAGPEVCIFDLDVGGYYPSLAIANQLAPRHLGEPFVRVYREIVAERAKHAKGTAENAMMKLAGNGVYGDSGNPYSPFYDLSYMLAVTVNGQLLLCMLAEQIMRVPTVKLIQINTDGLTMTVERAQLPAVRAMCDWWQSFTRLKLEENFYREMYIRDVNAYVAVTESGKIKRKGPFSWKRGLDLGSGDLAWHQDQSALIVPMAAEAHMLEGARIDEYIMGHTDIFDFLLRVKVPRTYQLELADGTKLPNITRYLVAREGQAMWKIMPPPPGCKVGEFKRANGLTDAYFQSVVAEIGGSTVWDERIHTKNKSQYEERRTGIEVGWKVKPCNHIKQASFADINYQYYITKARELVASVGL